MRGRGRGIYSARLYRALHHLPRCRIHAYLPGAVDHISYFDSLGEEWGWEGGFFGLDGDAGCFGHGYCEVV